MSEAITNSYRAQILKANVGLLRQLGPKIIKPKQCEEMIRVIEDIVARLQASNGQEKAA